MTPELCFCPRCGHDLVLEQRMKVGPLDYDPRGPVLWDGQPVNVTAAQHLLLGSLVLARGAIVGRLVLAERIGADCDSNVVEVLLCRLRKELRVARAPANTIQTLWGRGYRLNVEMLETWPC